MHFRYNCLRSRVHILEKLRNQENFNNLNKKHDVLKNADNEDFKENDFVKDMIPDPSNLLDSENLNLVHLQGYLGKSKDAGYWRLYFDKNLTDFCEIPAKDIVKHESVKKNSEEYTVVWLKPGTKLLHTTIKTAQEIESGFLQGDIVRKYLSSDTDLDQFVTSFIAGGVRPGGGLVAPPQTTALCEIIIVTITITVKISRALCTGRIMCG
jgi:hypothetical protein